MKKEDLVKKTEQIANSIHETATQQKYDAPLTEKENATKLLRKEKQNPNVQKILPKRRIRIYAKPNKKFEKLREHENEYVVGILENRMIPNESLHFWKNNMAGDDYCEWNIPAGIPVSIPRHVANHIHDKLKYHTFKHREKPAHEIGPDQFIEKFEVISTEERATFLPIAAF